MSTPRPRRANETDAEYQAVLNATVRDFNEANRRAQAATARTTMPKTTTPKTTTPTTTPTTTTPPSGPPAPGPVRSDYKIPLKMQLPAKQPTPIKRAAGGAAKVRKDMMSPEGKILHAMNKLRGK
jgi:hypothetical protein